MEVFNPLNLKELSACLNSLEPGAAIAGGCTDLSVRFLKKRKPEQLLNLTLVRELKEITVDGGFLRLGAAATLSEIEEYPAPEGFAALKQAVSGVGSKQVRNAATIGGNVANASPAGDLLPCLFMYGATVEYMKPGGNSCELPIADVIIGVEKTSLAYNESITAIKIPLPPKGTLTGFYKLGFRKKVTLARINIAMSASGPDGKADDVGFYLGAVAPVPLRVPEAEKILLENKWDEGACEKLTEYLSGMLNRIVPEAFDRDYKKYAVKGAVHDILQMFPYWSE